MEGNASHISDRPSSSTHAGASPAVLEREQEKWDAWKANEGLSRTEAKRRYIEKLIETMHKYASQTDEARELVEELEFVWEQVRNNSLPASSERSSPLQNIERSGYLHGGSFRDSGGGGGVTSSAAALENAGDGRGKDLRILSPVSQKDEDEALEMEEEEFVDAPISQYDAEELHSGSDHVLHGDVEEQYEARGRNDELSRTRRPPQEQPRPEDTRWRRRIEAGIVKLTAEVAALREQLESRRFVKQQRRHSLFGWVLRFGWWAAQLFIANTVLLWIVILYMRRKQDRRLEGAVRVLLGDAVAQVQRVTGREVKMPQLPKMPQIASKKAG